jgi:hypothetical protein
MCAACIRKTYEYYQNYAEKLNKIDALRFYSIHVDTLSYSSLNEIT